MNRFVIQNFKLIVKTKHKNEPMKKQNARSKGEYICEQAVRSAIAKSTRLYQKEKKIELRISHDIFVAAFGRFVNCLLKSIIVSRCQADEGGLWYVFVQEL